ncbi:MAG: 2-oxo-4-hydroxy-4-carboxy-5-ureidoimidazoline decarboxylase [Planctomycetota bacterium]
MPIQTDRLRRDIETIAAITQTPGAGATRPTFSKEWGDAVAYIANEATKLGCVVRRDSAGNLFCRCGKLEPDEPAWLVGSHLDTVPHGGDYDGVAGVVVGLELLRAAADDDVAVPVELVVFAEEEGPTFGMGMLGSRALVGELTADNLCLYRNAAGETYVDACKPYAGELTKLHDHLGLIELHVEQGPGMWRRDQRIAIVESIAGRFQYRVSLEGEANHAGATAMSDRRDALCAASEMVNALEQLAPTLSEQAVMTVGRFEVKPNAVNVIPDRVEFTIDFRAPDDAQLETGDKQLRTRLTDIANARRTFIAIEQTEAIPARPMHPALVDQLAGDLPRVMSGALHDAAVLAPHLPTAMLFVPSRDGISHNPAEFSRVEDIAEAAAVVERAVRRPTIAQLNGMTRERFTQTLGGIFEHSPWIAERAWDTRPFANVDDLHAKMIAVVDAATQDEQLDLICAHPDLVGKLAKAGRLTAESTDEQKAAGLDQLTADEADAFDRFNADYRNKFGFPFVICARENRKDAILDAFPERLANDAETERRTALAEIAKIARLRLADLVWTLE